MWRIPLSILLFCLIIFVCHRISEHFKIAQNGGIRKQYNRIFSFIYHLPNSRIIFETKSLVRFIVNSESCNLAFMLNYDMDILEITCSIKYKDDTAFNNGTKKKWSVSKYSNEEKTLEQMKEELSKLPHFPNF